LSPDDQPAAIPGIGYSDIQDACMGRINAEGADPEGKIGQKFSAAIGF
jgi:hypothetical protein